MPVFPDFDRFFSISEWLNGRLSAYDNKFRIIDNLDNTKQVAFQASGLTTGTTRTVTLPNYDFSMGTSGGGRTPVLEGAASLTLTEAMSGSLIACGAAEDFVLPTLTAANLGLVYEFVVITTATSLTVTAAATQLLRGGVPISSTTVNEGDAFSADGTDDLVFTMNGTTTGGIIGSWVKFWGRSTTSWVVTGNLIGSGTIVTPFS